MVGGWWGGRVGWYCGVMEVGVGVVVVVKEWRERVERFRLLYI